MIDSFIPATLRIASPIQQDDSFLHIPLSLLFFRRWWDLFQTCSDDPVPFLIHIFLGIGSFTVPILFLSGCTDFRKRSRAVRRNPALCCVQQRECAGHDRAYRHRDQSKEQGPRPDLPIKSLMSRKTSVRLTFP
jgi:hypothetical protein